jgi:hypothetical protein
MAGLAIVVVLLLMPVAYVELGCRGESRTNSYQPLITDPASQRREANTYLTYPEWHIVYAYDGLAEALKAGDEHRFDYWSSIRGFWRSACAVMRVADEHGGADWGTRSTIHTIGVSFTAEMSAKAAYEETIGRATATLRGSQKTPQDRAVAEMASDYAAFLRQTPWYEYPFTRERRELWAAPTRGVRAWERRLGIGLEFTAKAAYAKVIAGAVAATAPATLVIRSVVAGLDEAGLAKIANVTIIGARSGGVEIETPRYDLFTRILAEIGRRGGSVREIAGNDDIMVTLTVPAGVASPNVRHGRVIMRTRRDGFPGDRLLVDVKVPELALLLTAYPLGDPGVEHVFDY